MGKLILERYLGKFVQADTSRGQFSGRLTQGQGETFLIGGESFLATEITKIHEA